MRRFGSDNFDVNSITNPLKYYISSKLNFIFASIYCVASNKLNILTLKQPFTRKDNPQ